MALIKCEECAREISDQALACPGCGAPVNRAPASSRSKPKGSINANSVALFFVGIVAIGAWLAWLSSNKPPATLPPDIQITEQTTPIQEKSAALMSSEPVDQEAFEQARVTLYDAYKSAPNEIRASAIFNQANAATSALVARAGPNISNWVGAISELTTSHGGVDVHVEIKTSNNAVYQLENDAPAGSTIYKQLSVLRKGQLVFFSGTLIPEGGVGQRWERSLTEDGSLREPDFRVTFSSIGTSPVAENSAQTSSRQENYTVTPSPQDIGAAQPETPRAGPSGGYGARVAAAVRSNVVFPDADLVSGNPAAEFDVRLAPDGVILGSPKLIKSSGLLAWDEAALRALEKTERLPGDIDGRVPPALIIDLRPKR